jgi:8-hydroxy-5-deazaflavin:NADPH oxidoreductase
MKVTIIGTGNVGQALGGTIARAGHDVTLTARDPEKTASVAEAIGAHVGTSIESAARDADVVVLAVPYAAVAEVAEELRPIADGKVLVDVTNPLTPDYSGLATEGTASAAEQLAEQLPEARVVKAFNTLFGSVQAQPDALGTPVDALYATSDDLARHVVAELIESAGFRPVDAGSLEAASQLEALAFLNIQMQMRFGGDWRSAFVIVGAPEAATAVPAARAA